MNTIKSVYVAGAYTAETDALRQLNVETAVDVGNFLLDLGFFPYVPHLSHYQHARKARHYEEWMALDFYWLSRCDALFRLPGPSKGADREVEFARKQGIPVFTTISDLVDSTLAPLPTEVPVTGLKHAQAEVVAEEERKVPRRHKSCSCNCKHPDEDCKDPRVEHIPNAIEGVGLKTGEGKRDWSLLPWDEVAGMVDAFADGIKPGKYQRDDWKNGVHEKMIRVALAATMRHLHEFTQGHMVDKSSKLHPLEHMLADVAIMLWHSKQLIAKYYPHLKAPKDGKQA